MVVARTDLGNTKEAARRERFEPSATNTATNVQEAIQNAAIAPTNPSARLPGSAATVAILSTDTEVGINTATTAVSVNLPSIATWLAANPLGLDLMIFDDTGNAGTHNITAVPNGTDSFVQSITPVITGNYGKMSLRPVLGAPNKWFIKGLN